jgi:hypothetical protein
LAWPVLGAFFGQKKPGTRILGPVADSTGFVLHFANMASGVSTIGGCMTKRPC